MCGSPCRTATPARWPASCWRGCPTDDPMLEADRRQAARVLAERARDGLGKLPPQGRRLGRDARARPAGAGGRGGAAGPGARRRRGRLLDIGTGTGRVLELLAPRVSQGLGVDASKAMLALARARLARPGLAHCAVRLADMYRLPLADASFDIAGAADGAALRRGPGGRAGRSGARAAARRAADGGRSGAARAATTCNQAGASLARLLRRRTMRALLQRRRHAAGRTAGDSRSARGADLAWHTHGRCPDCATARTRRLKDNTHEPSPSARCAA